MVAKDGDLVVDRSRLFNALTRVQGWVPVDSYANLGPGQRQPRSAQERAYPLSQCMSCGCCLDACPQYLKIELTQQAGESDEDFEARKLAAHNTSFVGAHALSQVVLFNLNPTGQALKDERLDALMGPGGVTNCGNAQNCVAVCPKEIPLTTSIAQAGRDTTLSMVKRWFEA